MCAWRVWWLAHGKHRLQQIQNRLEQMRPRFVSMSAWTWPGVTEDKPDGWRPYLSISPPVAVPDTERGLPSQPQQWVGDRTKT